jgi:hypothetical protein
MRRQTTALLACLLLLAPQAARADAFLFTLDIDNGGGFEFDANSFRLSAPFSASLGVELVSGFVELVSGPLLDLQVSGGDPLETLYTFGPGQVSVTAHWTCGGPNWPCDIGLPAEGTFTGALDGLTIALCEGCSVTEPGARGDVNASLGTGQFSTSFALLLGVSETSSGGGFFMPVDGVSGEPASTELRVGGSASGLAHLEVEADPIEVPEPGLAALTAASLASLLVRRRRARNRPLRSA